jgi:hypothetical protein
MKRFARVASILVAGLIAGTATALAQAPAAAVPDPPFHAAFDFGPAFGHESSGFFAVDIGARVMGPLGVFIEGGQIRKVGSDDLDARAAKVGAAVGAVATAVNRVNFGGVGVVYAPPMPSAGRFQPYATFSGGVAQVRSTTTLTVNGAVVTPDSLGILFGTDLDGAVKKPYVTFGGGVTIPLAQRFYGDVSFRLMHILAKTDNNPNDVALNSARIQLGIGVRFP